MKNIVGELFISNNKSEYNPDIKQFVYSFKFAYPIELEGEVGSEYGSTISLICNDEFKRGDILKIFLVNEEKKIIYVELVKDDYQIRKLPVLLFLSFSVGVDKDSEYEFESRNDALVVFTQSIIYKGSKFYNLAVLVSSPMTVVSGYDKRSDTTVEWVLSSAFRE